ncbi:hypothetical protein HYI78_003634 [Salmonella enterica]|nr:hypothetical protein [Salmonella enterica]EKO6872630.1 hypothetical protein [Salmonella enterica]
MKLNLSDIKFSGSGYVSTTIDVGVGPYPLLLSMCTMHVSVPLVEGKALEQYKEELLAKAREQIAHIYKEIVCGGEPDDEIVITVHGKLNGKHKIRVVNKNGKLSVAGAENDSGDGDPEKRVASTEEQLSTGLDTGALNAIYAVSKKATVDFLSQKEKHPAGEALDGKALVDDAMKTFLVEDGDITMSASQVNFVSPLHKGRLTLNSEGYLTITSAKL